ncbi:LysM peptidoglycan-binding domain-containing protein [Flavobacterium sp. GCM10027622]|uniref:LysM peptidoglycan-binding domain-containing protein n=1 Tax=unclassified Flavobacterium TaxID=196869 RepID=UPI00360F9514
MEKGYNDFKTHIVKKEDTVQSICSQYGISEAELVQANPNVPLVSYGGGFFSSPTYRLDIKEGDTLQIPFFNEEKSKSGVKTIKGKNLVKVGEWETYEVEEWFEGTPEADRNPANVKWELHYLQNDTNPQKILEKNEGHFRFQEKAAYNKYKIIAFLNEPDPNGAGSLIVNVEPSEKAEILSVKLSDINNNPISKPLAYGEIVNAHVETTGLKGQFIYISLWEDDATGDGHSSENEKNLVEDGKVEVGDKGVAHKQFVLKPDFKKVANAYLAKGDSSEGSTHEYYVTAFASGETKASANLNVRNPDFQRERKTETGDHLSDKKQPPKPIVPPFKKNVPLQQPKKATPPVTQGKVGISNVSFSDVNGRPISGTVTQSALRVNIKSTGLKGKEIRFKLYEEDVTENELLLVKNFTLTGDDFTINLSLDKIPKSSGDDFFEGSTQELFVDIEVIESKAHIKSSVIDVDTKAFKHEPAESTTVAKVSDVKLPEKKDEKKTGCICKDYDLIWGNKVSCDFRKKVVEVAKNLGLPQEKNEGANWLMAVMALETGRTFSPTCGTFKKHKDDSKNGYVGLIQIGKVAAIDLGVKRTELLKLTNTEQLEYVEKFFKQKKFTGKLKTKTDLYLAVNYPNACGHGTEKDYVVYDSSKDAYDDNPMFKREKDEYFFDKKGKKQFYEGKKGSSYVWEFEEAINDFYNEGVGYKLNFFGTCPIILKNTTDKDIVTYHVYHDGKIEKRIPKEIKEGFEKKYKYVYHDKSDKEHAICILDWHNTKGKDVGVVFKTKPTHAEVLSDDNVSEGSTSRRVKYKNDDIAEYGKHPTKGKIWRLYKSNGKDIELIKMPDSLSYSNGGIVVKYEFSQTKRRYTGPGVFAGFVGALAECSFSDGIVTTGSCFKEASCFPSAEHVNGRSVDTIYYNNLNKDQKFVDAVIKFKFTEVLVGNNDYCKKIKNASDGGALHNSHLHSGNFSDDKITEIKK